MEIKRINIGDSEDVFMLLDDEGIPIEHISRYLKELYYERNMKSNSIKLNAQCLKQYLEFLNIMKIDYLNPPDFILNQYNEYLHTLYENEKTILSKLKVVKDLYKHLNIYINQGCLDKKYRKINNKNKINFDDSKKVILTNEDIHRVLEDISDIRDKLLLNLLLITGARCNEIINLQISDFINKDGNWCVKFKNGKGDIHRINVIPKQVMELFFEYQKLILNNVKNNEDGFLFVHIQGKYEGKRLSISYINKVLTNIRKKTGINISMTTIRYFYNEYIIKSAFENMNVDIREYILKARGDQSLNTLVKYLINTDLKKLSLDELQI